MSYTKIISLLCLIAIAYIAESAICPSQDSCQHNYGRRLVQTYQDQATFLNFTTVPPQISGYDPIPCCIKCYEQPGCDYYYLEFANGNCTLFSLPDNDKFVMNLVAGRYYDKVTYEGCCIGYPNVYIFNNMPEA